MLVSSSEAKFIWKNYQVVIGMPGVGIGGEGHHWWIRNFGIYEVGLGISGYGFGVGFGKFEKLRILTKNMWKIHFLARFHIHINFFKQHI